MWLGSSDSSINSSTLVVNSSEHSIIARLFDLQHLPLTNHQGFVQIATDSHQLLLA